MPPGRADRSSSLRCGARCDALPAGAPGTARPRSLAGGAAADATDAVTRGIIKLFGLGLAAAVFIDAVIVRSVLVPAVMQLFGERAWWLPAWLDRILPRLHVKPAEGDPSPTGEHPLVESA